MRLESKSDVVEHRLFESGLGCRLEPQTSISSCFLKRGETGKKGLRMEKRSEMPAWRTPEYI